MHQLFIHEHMLDGRYCNVSVYLIFVPSATYYVFYCQSRYCDLYIVPQNIIRGINSLLELVFGFLGGCDLVMICWPLDLVLNKSMRSNV